MTSSAEPPTTFITAQEATPTALVTRSSVPAGLKYPEYKPYLRPDFFYSCAYCTMTESEAQAIRFTIDHYEPRFGRPDLENQYSNLMYACDECNQRKGNRSPPETARNSGVRFFRPDQDFHHEHFEKSGIRLKPKSITGKFTIDAIDLNRLTLRRIREIRSRLTECDRFVAGGISALRTIHIDHLPAHIKAQAANSIRNASRMGKMLADNIDLLLSDYARSPLIDSDPEATARTIERASELKKLEALYPGSWRASSKQIQRPKRSKRTKKT